jgi:hypothetical protein
MEDVIGLVSAPVLLGGDSVGGAEGAGEVRGGGEISTNRRGRTPLFWQQVRPYGEVRLHLNARLSIGTLGVSRRTPCHPG